MIDLIESIRQMMAEENFSGAEEALEHALLVASAPRFSLIELYLETLIHLQKSLPDHLVSEVISDLWEKNPEHAIKLFQHASDSLKHSSDIRILFFQMRLASSRGQIQELHERIVNYQLRLYERNLPTVSPLVSQFITRYFRHDFQLQIQSLALTLVRHDFLSAEDQLKRLIFEAHEKSTPKILREKLTSLGKILSSETDKGHLEIYQNLIHLILHGFKDKKDYKRLAEAVIYFDDFRFGVMIMQTLLTYNHEDLASSYAGELAAHPNYDFVYIAKHFPSLKKFFVTMTTAIPRVESHESPDLTLSEVPSREINFSQIPDRSDDEQLLIGLVKTQDYDDSSLLDLAVSFIQSELPRVALAASLVVHGRAEDKRIRLKAAYLALTALLQIGDYRSALDLALESMTLIETKADLLSFLYCEAEAYLRLDLKREARQVLKKIISIDAGYRMARERLEKLE